MACFTEGPFDNALLGILQQCSGIEIFLDHIFSFLKRRTDFYITLAPPVERRGFPPGIAEALVKKAFCNNMIVPPVPNVAKEEIVQSDNSHSSIKKLDESIATTTSKPSQNTPLKESKSNLEEKESIPTTQKTLTKVDQAPSENYNGGISSLCEWTQTVSDVDIKLLLPQEPCIKSNDLSVVIKSDSLDVKLFGKSHFSKKLPHRVCVEDSFWNFESSTKCIRVYLDKSSEKWWDRCFEGDDSIDLSKVDTTINLFDLPADERAVIDKLQYDERQKQLGKPTSKQQQTLDMLKKGWDAKDSPFKGQEFDPTAFDIAM